MIIAQECFTFSWQQSIVFHTFVLFTCRTQSSILCRVVILDSISLIGNFWIFLGKLFDCWDRSCTWPLTCCSHNTTISGKVFNSAEMWHFAEAFTVVTEQYHRISAKDFKCYQNWNCYQENFPETLCYSIVNSVATMVAAVQCAFSAESNITRRSVESVCWWLAVRGRLEGGFAVWGLIFISFCINTYVDFRQLCWGYKCITFVQLEVTCCVEFLLFCRFAVDDKPSRVP